MKDLSLLKEGVKSFNNKKNYEAMAKLLRIGRKCFEVEIEGNFSEKCGMDKYLNNLLGELKSLGLQVELEDFKPLNDNKYLAKYQYKD